jgi:hypothetical protein
VDITEYIYKVIPCDNCKYQSCLNENLHIDENGFSACDLELKELMVDLRIIKMYKRKCRYQERLEFLKDFIYYDKVRKCYDIDQLDVAVYMDTLGYWVDGKFHPYPSDPYMDIDPEEYYKNKYIKHCKQIKDTFLIIQKEYFKYNPGAEEKPLKASDQIRLMSATSKLLNLSIKDLSRMLKDGGFNQDPE